MEGKSKLNDSTETYRYVSTFTEVFLSPERIFWIVFSFFIRILWSIPNKLGVIALALSIAILWIRSRFYLAYICEKILN